MTTLRAPTLVLLIVFQTLLCTPGTVSAEDLPKRLHNGELLRGTFVQERMLSGFDAPLRSSGRYALAPEQGLLWKVDEPFAVTTAITEGGLVQTASGTEVTRLKAEHLPALNRLYALLTAALAGNWRALEKEFRATWRRSGNRWQVELAPPASPNGGPIPIVGLTVRGGRFVEEVEVRKTKGDVDRIRFQNQQITREELTPAEKALLDATSR